MASYFRHPYFSLFISTIICLCYIIFSYTLQRTDFTELLLLWLGLFFLSYKMIEYNRNRIRFLIVIAIVFRVVFLFSTPNLSQDFYRFIWDGRMLLEGINPYLSIPENWIRNGNVPIAQAQQLYEGMGRLNGSHYTNYPPVSQFFYFIAGIFAAKNILGSVIVLRLLIILADIGTLFFGKKLLISLKLPEYRIFWYILNPFVIIELTGNLHFEGIMIFFIIWSLYLFQKGFWQWAAVVLGLSVSVKLIPLLFLPLFFQKFMKPVALENQVSLKVSLKKKKRKLIWFYALVLGTATLTFIPFLSSEFLLNFSKTVLLWFQKFEFNASIFYMIRWIGFQILGWNIIGIFGVISPLVVILILLAITFNRNNNTTPQLITAMVLGICSYYFLSTTVHPWYVAVPLCLCIFTNYKFPIWWSFMVFLSYTAYTHPSVDENLWMVALEYTIVIGIFIFEILKNEDKKLLKFSFR